MPTMTFTDDEWSLLVSAVGTSLDIMSLDVKPGQPTPPDMVKLEQLQAKLMSAQGETK